MKNFDTDNELYSKIEHLIIKWNIDGTKTAGYLTRQIMKLLSNFERTSTNEERDKERVKELKVIDIEHLQTDSSEITFGDYFLEVGEYKYIHQLVEDYYEHHDYKLPNGIEVIVLSKIDFDFNNVVCGYRKIVNIL